ncbi:MAG: PKD domain-containing protein, partial [Gammaproteobacteria bacterium]|nr:PKD domain-containing protein [Desulfobacterales bacterium]NIR92275.1 PKD domain-containing protein [Gammaproteobacteria bacterium]
MTVTGCPPLANFSWQPSHPLINETVTFDASSSAPNGGVITFYRWDFGDGTPPQQRLLEPQITHSFTKPGNYQITLTVTDSEDLNDSISKIMTIGAPPDANFTYSPPDPQTYEAVTFNASTSSANGGVIIDYTWDFGDGNTTTVTKPEISHYFSTSGDFLVILNVTDSDGLWDTESETVSVAAAAKPNADFTWSPLSPYVNETITFNASKSAPNGGMITSYQWTFGDGNSITQSNPIANHSYPLEGNYTVTLNVTDSQG